MVFGPCEHDVKLDSLNESNAQIWRIVSSGREGTVPPTGMWRWVDVRDVAAAHVAVIDDKVKGNQRFLVSGGEFSWQKVQYLDFLRSGFQIGMLTAGWLRRLSTLRGKSSLRGIFRLEIRTINFRMRDLRLMFRVQKSYWESSGLRWRRVSRTYSVNYSSCRIKPVGKAQRNDTGYVDATQFIDHDDLGPRSLEGLFLCFRPMSILSLSCKA